MTTAPAEPIARCLRQLATAHLGDLPDRELLERYAGRRDEAAFTALVHRHGPLVLGVCRRVLRDVHAADDAFQATFLILARKAASIGRPEALGPWLYGVAVRVAHKARLREVRRRAAERRAAALAPPTTGPEDLAWRDLRPLLDEAVGGLPERLRVPFVLHYLEGRTVTAVAQLLGCPRGTIATHLARARQRLRGRLQRRGLTLSTVALGGVLAQRQASGVLTPSLPRFLEKGAGAFAACQGADGTVPASVAILAQGGLRTMPFSKRMILPVVLLLGLGAVGGTLLLARAGAPAEPGTKAVASSVPSREETDIALFRVGARHFFAENYPEAARFFTRLRERFPDSPLAQEADWLEFAARDMSTTDVEASAPLARARVARQVIRAALAGIRAAEARSGRESDPAAARTRRKVSELMREYTTLSRQGKYQEAERYAVAALELDPDNALLAAVVETARAHSRTSTKGAKERAIERLLDRSVTLSFKDTPLTEVLDDLRAAHGLNVIVDRPALVEEHVNLDSPVTIKLQEVSLKTALGLVLRQVHLTYVIRDEIIHVTTESQARGNRVTRTYPVEDLVGGDARDAETLIRVIGHTIAPSTWAEVGGPGTIDYFPIGKALVVNQTPDVQEQLADFLAALRRLKGSERNLHQKAGERGR
jgi:RNA polymerase sigma factor (sigma-70 family)